MDEELDATSLRMYNEADEPEQYSVKVEQSMRPGKQSNPFHERIVELVDQSGDLWGEFSRVVADEVSIRARHLQNRLDTRRRE